jgi:probable HAF family extracellular repeat protein
VAFRNLLIVGLAAITFVLIAPVAPGTGQSALYSPLDLNLTTEERVNFGRTVNLFNQVVGRSGAINGASTRAMLWGADGNALSLDALPGGDYSAAFGLNNSGEVVGSSNTDAAVRAFYWTNGRFELLDILPGDTGSEAFAINNSSDAVGYSSGPNGMVAVLWRDRREINALGSLPGGDFSIAYAINNRGDVAGESGSAGGARGFVWTAQDGMRELAPLPGHTASGAAAINNQGQIVGYSSGSNGSRAVLWSGGRVRDLGTLPGGSFSRAYSINNLGIVVGTSDSTEGTRAFIWSEITGMVDLNTRLPLVFDHILTEAASLNDSGVIVASSGGGPHLDIEGGHEGEAGGGHGDDHHYHVFLLKP